MTNLARRFVSMSVAEDKQALFHLVDVYAQHLRDATADQHQREHIVKWMRNAPSHAAIVVLIPDNIAMPCRTQKIVSFKHCHPTKFVEIMNKMLGINSLSDSSYESHTVESGAIYHKNGEYGPWDASKMNDVNIRAMALANILAKSTKQLGLCGFFGSKKSNAVQPEEDERCFFYGDVVFYATVNRAGHMSSAISCANMKSTKENLNWGGLRMLNNDSHSMLDHLRMNEDKVSTFLQDIFAMYDVDHDHFINVDELHAMMAELNIAYRTEGRMPTKDAAKTVLEALDSDKNGTLEIQEFVSWVMSGLKQTRKTLERFCARGGHFEAIHDFLDSIIADIRYRDGEQQDKSNRVPTKNDSDEEVWTGI